MIKTVIKLVDAQELCTSVRPEHVQVTYDGGNNLRAMSWRYDPKDGSGLRKKAKRRGAQWDHHAGGWTFSDPAKARDFLDEIIKGHPDWPIIGDPGKPFMPLAGVGFSRIPIKGGLEACLVPFPLPHFSRINGSSKIHGFRIAASGKPTKKEAGLLVGTADDIAGLADSLGAQGAIRDDTLAVKWPFTSGTKLQVKVSGWAVQIICDLANPAHYTVAPPQKHTWEGVIHATRKSWSEWKTKIDAAGLEWEGDDPGAELAVPVAFDESRVAGWSEPAPNGYLLHAYQKEGARFCAARGMRALIGDEMGVGKTVQAIAAAEAVDAPRILVICPANARYVWDREIWGWGGRGAIQHITSQLDMLDMSARWHIVTYDLIAARAEAWRLKDVQEEEAVIVAFPGLKKKIEQKPGGYPRKVVLDRPLDKAPAFADPNRIAAWGKAMQRLRGELLNQFLSASAGKLLVILDEAHRVKNQTAKRTKTIQRITAAGEARLLMLTGTPLRNNEHEAAVLLGLLEAEASIRLSKEKGYTVQDVRDYLGHFMIRRTKSEVLPELPEKTRQRIDIGELDPEMMETYRDRLDWAEKSYRDALKKGGSEAEARQAMQGGIEQARTALGLAKVRGGEVADLVADVVENKGCCVVFCAHHQVSDTLMAQLEKLELRAAVVDGRTGQKERVAIVQDFQEGLLDVFIGGVNAAGEAITLTRADTVIFVELDWVPAAMLQAEDRIHRVGQRSNCQVIHLVGKMPGSDSDNLDAMMIDLIGSKIARIGAVLDEDTANIIDGNGSIQGELHARLLAGAGQEVAQAPAADARQHRLAEDLEPEQKIPGTSADVEKRKRGRPKVYIDKEPPTATERSKHSIKALATAGGKRIMLRLTPEAHEALKAIMALTGGTQETATINQALVAVARMRMNASTR